VLQNAGDFFRVHHSYLINLKFIQKYIRGEGGEVIMSNGKNIPVARSRKQDFMNILEKI
jgi:two-component system LytT family response regulator